MKIYVRDIIRLCNGKLICGNEDVVCNIFSKDTRIIMENDVYVGIVGEKFDGNSFYEQAFENGASVCILDKFDENTDLEKFFDKTIVVVPNSVDCLQKLAIYKRSLYDIPVVAVTGSVGKTSTKDMVASVLAKKYKVLKTEGNLNNHIGLPLTILKLDNHECLVVEMGMNHFDEIRLLTNIAKPTMAIITNIGTAHIGILGSRENILKAKLEILDGLCNDKVVITNNDNDMLNSVKEMLDKDYKLITVGIDNKSDYMASNIEQNEDYSTFVVNNNTNVRVNVATLPFIYNSLIAFAVGKYENIDEDKINDAIASFELSSNRLSKLVNKNGVIIIDDTYNASYDSMKSAIDILRMTSGSRKIAVLGDMLELGSFSEDIHRNIGKVVVDSKIDILVTIGNASKYIAKEALELGFREENIYSFNKECECHELLNKLLLKEDVVLFKASHSIGLGNAVKYLMSSN